MSALFPNVPDVPGVPPVARAGPQLASILRGSTDAETSAFDTIGALDANDLPGASDGFTLTGSSASGALGLAADIFPDGSNVIGGLSGAVANASNGLTALASGDLAGARANAVLALDQAQSARETLTALVNPTQPPVLDSSGEEVNADTVLQWGLYTQDGDLAVEADNITAFENSLEARISDYPVAPNNTDTPTETVGFGSYNKVITPYEIRLVMTKGGSVEDRQDFLKAIQDAWLATTLYSVITPECVYLDVNVTGVRRTVVADRGVGLMALEVTLRKVRQTATLQFTQTKEATGSGQVNDGSVQTSQPPAAQQYQGAGR